MHHHTRLLNVSSSLCLPHPSASPFLFNLFLLFFYFPVTLPHVCLNFDLLSFHIPITPCLPHPSSPPIPHLCHPFSSSSFLTSPSLLLMPPPPCLLLYICITPLDAHSFISVSVPHLLLQILITPLALFLLYAPLNVFAYNPLLRLVHNPVTPPLPPLRPS